MNGQHNVIYKLMRSCKRSGNNKMSCNIENRPLYKICNQRKIRIGDQCMVRIWACHLLEITESLCNGQLPFFIEQNNFFQDEILKSPRIYSQKIK